MSKYKIMTPGPVQVPENSKTGEKAFLTTNSRFGIRNSMMNTRKPVS